jgi:hypothetical protein
VVNWGVGHIPAPTPEMGEYSTEVRRESFYLNGESTYGHVYEGQPRPHSPVLYVERRPLAGGDPLTDKERIRLEWVIAHGSAADPVVQDAHDALLDDARAWRLRAKEEYERVTTVGTVEFLIEDIPKIRALLDLVEEVHVRP